MAPTDLPEAAPNIEVERLLGAWYIVVSNYGFWQRRTHPRIEYTALAPDRDGRVRMLDSLRYRQSDLLGRVQRKLLVGIDVAEQPGRFLWRGEGMLKLVKSRWCVALVDPDYRWCVTWFARSNIGTAPGLDIYSRDPVLDQRVLDQILARIGAHPFLSQPDRPGGLRRCTGLFATTQDWIPPQAYRLHL